MKTLLSYTALKSALEGATQLVIIGRRARLEADDIRALLPSGAQPQLDGMLDSAKPGDAGSGASTWVEGPISRVAIGVLPELCSRHNSPARPHALTSLVRQLVTGDGPIAVVLALDCSSHGFAAGCAVSRAFSVYSRKTGEGAGAERVVRVAALPADDGAVDLEQIAATAAGIRLAARLVDAPPSELTTTAFVDIIRESIALSPRVEINVIEGEALAAGGFGGLWGVGKAAECPPALVVLDYTPENMTPTSQDVAWVGKGIVYDTGGLSIKPKTGMPGMKADMGGAAAVLGAFTAAVNLGLNHRIRALLCIAENAVGPKATRPDDILTMYSGKTVEVNNTDAEGRLVLADGVAYAARHLKPKTIIDLATLTGAQLVSTGRRHAAVMSDSAELEAAVVEAGRRSGDLSFPIPYCPEFFRKEFKSEVADMKNSVKDRMNAQSSCAGQFVAEHLGAFEGDWLHIDLAGPAGDGERGTGFGVALLLELLEDSSQAN